MENIQKIEWVDGSVKNFPKRAIRFEWMDVKVVYRLDKAIAILQYKRIIDQTKVSCS
jgi:hypothetical protein